MASTAELVVAFNARLDGLEKAFSATQRKAKDAEGSVQTLGQSLASLSDRSITRVTNSLRTMAAAYLGMQGLRLGAQLINSIDELNVSMQRVQAMTGLARESVVSLFTDLSRTASRTGTPLADLTTNFQRFYAATASIGATSRDVTQFLDTMARFGQASGQGPQEISAAMTQLSQGLASGRLQGDELKSILENMPILATELARELGVSVGQLRVMGAEGRLTAENVFPAIIAAGQRMAEQMAAIPPSLSQLWSAFQQQGLTAIANLDRALGSSQFFRQVIQGGVAALERLNARSSEDELTRLSAQMAELAGQTTALQRQLRDFDAGVARPGGADQMWRSGATPAQQRDTIVRRIAENERLLREGAERQRQLGEQQWQRQRVADALRAQEARDAQIAEGDVRARAIADSLRPQEAALRQRDQRLRDLEREMAARRARDAERGDQASEVAATRALEAQRRADIMRSYRETVDRAGASAARDAEQAETRRLREARSIREAESRAIENILRGGEHGLTGLTTTLTEWFEPVTVQIENRTRTLASGIDLVFARVRENTEGVKQFFASLNQETQRAAQQVARAGGDPNQVLDALSQRREDFRRAWEQQNVVGDFDAAWTEFINRTTRGLDRLRDKSEQTFNDIAVQGVKTFSRDLAGGIVDWVATGEQKFSELLANFLKTMATMIAQMAIFNALKMAFGSSGLGWIDFTQRMAGGPVSAGRPYIVGERRPELFVPSSSGYVYPRVPGVAESTNLIIQQNAPGVVLEPSYPDERTVLVAVNASRRAVASDFQSSMRTGYGAYSESMTHGYNVRRRL